MRATAYRLSQQALKTASAQSPKPRHLMAISDLSAGEFTSLVRNAGIFKKAFKSGTPNQSLTTSLLGRTVAMVFSKRSTRTRVSTESAVNMMGGHPMFLGKDDIQLGVNESLYDTSVVLSSMTSCIVARVGEHSEVTGLAKSSSVPVINALFADFHPLQIVADFLTMVEAHPSVQSRNADLGLHGLKVAWVGDSNNVLFDLASACVKMGAHMAVASPEGFGIPDAMRKHIQACSADAPQPGSLSETTIPEEAVKDADIIVTDTWISMGQESEMQRRLKAFAGYQVTEDLAKRGGAKPDWKFMHCLPRHQEEVADEVFYGDRSLVFPEAENRLWAAMAALEAFVVRKGKIQEA